MAVEEKLTQIHLLSPEIIQSNPKYARTVDRLRKGLFKEIGWHYWVDLTWILTTLDKLGIPQGATIVDAGAGYGLLQFLLAYAGYNVISVDFSDRKPRSLHKLIFNIHEYSYKSNFSNAYIDQINKYNRSKYQPRRLMTFLRKNWDSFFWYCYYLVICALNRKELGRIQFYRADIMDMGGIKDSTVDVLVSCSVIEHLKPDDIPLALNEFSRVLKPGRPMIITTSAARDRDWFHKSSLGWCFSKNTLSDFFKNSLAFEDCLEDFDQILQKYKNSEELKKRLPSSYYFSQYNGMPWGVWDPKYVPVGIVKYADLTGSSLLQAQV